MIGREDFINVALTGQIWTTEVETSHVPAELLESTFGDHGVSGAVDFAREIISCALGKESERNVDWRSESAAQHDHVMTILPDSCSLWRASGNTPEVFLFDLQKTIYQLKKVRGRASDPVLDEAIKKNLVEDLLARLAQAALKWRRQGRSGKEKGEGIIAISIPDERFEEGDVRTVCFATESRDGATLEVFFVTDVARYWNETKTAREHFGSLYDRHFRHLASVQRKDDWRNAFVGQEEHKAAELLLEVCSREMVTPAEVGEVAQDLISAIAERFQDGNRQPLELVYEPLPEHHDIGMPTANKPGDINNPLTGFLVRDESEHLLGYVVYCLDSKTSAEELKERLKKNNIFHNVLMIYPPGSEDVLEIWYGEKTLPGRLLKKGPLFQGPSAVATIIARFMLVSQSRISTPLELALDLARRAQFLRKYSLSVLNVEGGNTKAPMTELHELFNSLLVKQTRKEFADTFAQTLTYGLLAARWTSKDLGDKFSSDLALSQLRSTSPIVSTLFEKMLRIGNQRLGWLIDDLIGLLRRTAVGKVFAAEVADPVIHFYEPFLSYYDKKLKKSRGVYYTPQSVVKFIVRGLHTFLQDDFGLADGLADTSSWSEVSSRCKFEVPSGVDPCSDFVKIIDLATGTGTFLVEVVEIIHQTVTENWSKQGIPKTQWIELWTVYVENHLLPRLCGLEIMIAPYVIAQLKIGMKLRNTGYTPGKIIRPNIFLTNAVEVESEQAVLTGMEEVSAEAKLVKDIKESRSFTVVCGNPPYSSVSQNMNPFISNLVKRYTILPDGPMEERSNRNHLQDDYVKFVRLGHMYLERSGAGIMGLITNNSFLYGNWHRAMRYQLTKAFPRIAIVNLHGGGGFVRIKSDEDENVFDIQQSVAISFFSSKSKIPQVNYGEVVGTRESKYQVLREAKLPDLISDVLTTSHENSWLFEPVSQDYNEEWEAGFPINEMFVEWGAGVKTNRDGLATALTKAELEHQIRTFADTSIDDEEVQAQFGFKSNYQWKVPAVRARFSNESFDPDLIVKYGYRPFDVRWVYWHSDIIFNMRGGKMEVFRSSNAPVGLLFSRNTTKERFTNFFVTRFIPDIHCLETMNVAPLYIESAASPLVLQKSRTPNLSPRFLAELNERLGKVTPEKVLGYLYALMFSHQYRGRYNAYLVRNFARFPITRSRDLFEQLSKMGLELIEIHLMESTHFAAQDRAQYIGTNNPLVGKIVWKDEDVFLNFKGKRDLVQDHFTGVSRKVWDYVIGGYPVCQKWLKGRGGQRLTLEDRNHFLAIVSAISSTISISNEIDRVLSSEGGWPIQ